MGEIKTWHEILFFANKDCRQKIKMEDERRRLREELRRLREEEEEEELHVDEEIRRLRAELEQLRRHRQEELNDPQDEELRNLRREVEQLRQQEHDDEIFGQSRIQSRRNRRMDSALICFQCNQQKPKMFQCGHCNDAIYCGQDCANAHWKTHGK